MISMGEIEEIHREIELLNRTRLHPSLINHLRLIKMDIGIIASSMFCNRDTMKDRQKLEVDGEEMSIPSYNNDRKSNILDRLSFRSRMDENPRDTLSHPEWRNWIDAESWDIRRLKILHELVRYNQSIDKWYHQGSLEVQIERNHAE